MQGGRYPGPPRGPPHRGLPPRHHGRIPQHHRPSPPLHQPDPFFRPPAYSPIHYQPYRYPLSSFRPPPPSRLFPQSSPHHSHRPDSPILPNATRNLQAPCTSVSASPAVTTLSVSPPIPFTFSTYSSSRPATVTSVADPPASFSPACSSPTPSASQIPSKSSSSISVQLPPAIITTASSSSPCSSPTPSASQIPSKTSSPTSVQLPPAPITTASSSTPCSSPSPLSTLHASKTTTTSTASQSSSVRTPIRKRLRSSSKPCNEQPIIVDSNEDSDPEYQYGGGRKKKQDESAATGKTSKKKPDWRDNFSLFERPLPLPLLSERLKKQSTSITSTYDFKLEKIKFYNPNLDEKFVTRILSGVMDVAKVHWDDVCGLTGVKQRLKEMVVYPMLNPALFSGLRSPGRGLLLFGPPGTGKTLIGKCLATEAQATFFSVTSSTFGSKWFGDAEVLAKTLFECAKALQPSIVFMDEVDSVLGTGSETDGGCATRLRTELLTNMDGCQTTGTERVLIIGATNHPEKVDEAARRRFTRRLYIPLPDKEARKDQILSMLRKEKHSLTECHAVEIATITEGYSGADIAQVCRNAAMEPIRSLDLDTQSLEFVTIGEVRAITVEDFYTSLKNTSKSVSPDMLKKLEQFNKLFGSN